MTDAKIAEIAGALSEAQRGAMVAGTWNVWPMSQQIIEAGLSKRSKERHFMVELTDLGLAARHHLIEQEKSRG